MEIRLKKLNPWWSSKKSINIDSSIKRKKYLNLLIKLIPSKEILTITGIRRVGKSTLQLQLIKYLIRSKKVNPKNILFFNIDAFTIQEKNSNALNLLLDEFYKLKNPKGRIYIFLDEIQNISDWENWIKSHYDLNKNLKFILTGSNSKLLHSELSKLLTGRIFNIQVHPLSFKEFLLFKKYFIKDLVLEKIQLFTYFKEYIYYGGFPEVVLEKDNSIKIFRLQEYYNGIILRDVLELNNVRETKEVLELSKYLISLSAKLFSYNKLSKIIGLSKTTVKEYFMHLQNAFLFTELMNFDYSLKKQLISERKTYAVDTGLINAMSFKFSEDKGRALENLVFIELKRRDKEVYFYKEKKECDFLIRKNLKIVEAIQVCLKVNLDDEKRELEGLLEVMFKYNLKKGLIITLDDEKQMKTRGKEILLVPIWKWLLIKN